MNTKEAIEFIENGIDLSTRELEKEYLKKMDGVISLLQQGKIDKEELKKYRQIVEGLEKDVADKTDIYSNWLRSDIKKLREKYFPKE